MNGTPPARRKYIFPRRIFSFAATFDSLDAAAEALVNSALIVLPTRIFRDARGCFFDAGRNTTTASMHHSQAQCRKFFRPPTSIRATCVGRLLLRRMHSFGQKFCMCKTNNGRRGGRCFS
jgi:hypothetical protein